MWSHGGCTESIQTDENMQCCLLECHDSGTCETWHGQRALELSQQMHHEGVEADPGTFVGVLNACASVGALGRGRRVCEQIIQCGFESDIFVDGSLADMYAKCGAL